MFREFSENFWYTMPNFCAYNRKRILMVISSGRVGIKIARGRRTGVLMMNILSRGKQIRNVRWHDIVIDIMH